MTTTVPVGITPEGVAVSPDNGHAYVANLNSNMVSVIDTGSNTVTTTIPVGSGPWGVAIADVPIDTTPPAAPVLTDSDPDSPAGDPSPHIQGTAEAGSTVRLFTNATCMGSSVASGSAAVFASPGLAVSVAEDSSTTFYANATDMAGNTSGCSSGLTYVEDSTPPDTIIDSGPAVGSTTTASTATFTFHATETGSTFACKLDTGPWRRVTRARRPTRV